ncbi:MAG: MMPL family transporter [Deltaproteobacteria bacterium]|nr:MMPL family transporter [Deltaproteobacteria bacterium]
MRKWADWLYDHRLAAGAAILLLTLFFAWEVKNLDISTRFSDLYPRNHPHTKLFEKYPAFGSPFTVSLVIQVKKGTIYNPQTLQKIQEGTRLVDLIPGVDHDQILSIASRKVKHVEATVGGIQSSNLLVGPVPQTKEEIAKLTEKTRSTGGVIGALVSVQEDAALIQATFIERLTDFNVIFNSINGIIGKLQDQNHEVYAAGQPMLTGWVYHYQNEMYVIFGVGLVAMALFLVFHFRNISGVVTPLVVGITSAIWGFGFAGVLGYNLDPLIIVVPVLLVARALSHSVQMCERYFEIYNQAGDVRKASIESLISLFPPGVVGIICDAAGLFIIAIAPIRLIEKLAYVCGLWSLTLVITAILLTFLLLSYLPPPGNVQSVILTSERKSGFLYRIFSSIALFSSTRRWAVSTCTFFLAVTVLSGWWAFQRGIGDVNPGTPLLWPNSPYNLAIKRINERFAGFDVLQVVLEDTSPQGIRTSGALDLMQSFQRHMERDKEVGGTFSFADLVPQVNRLFHGGFSKWSVVPDADVDAAMLFQLAMTGASPGDFDRLFTRNFAAGNINVWYKDHLGGTVERALRRAREFIEHDKASANGGPNLRLASGTIGLLGALNETIGRLEILTVLLISLVIFVVTTFIYRSFIAGLLLTVISNIANLGTAAVMYHLGIGLDVNTLPIGAVGMGIGIDYNIYLMSRMCEEYRTNPDYAKLIPASIFTTGKAIFFTATTMIVGIILWYFMSSLRFQADMGLLLSSVMLAHVILALFFQAAFMMLLQPKFIQKGLFFTH